jgi:Uma2 family endonuclease
MKVGSLVSVEEYLGTDYSPDCDYVDGEIVERNVGERSHSLVQRKLILWFFKHHPQLHVWPEQRVQVSATRFRVPDICITLEDPGTGIFHTPPFIAIEILSQEDRLSRIQDKIEDFLAFGIPHVWVLDPRRRRAYFCDESGMHRVLADAFEIPELALRLPLAELFE